ncbi:MAG TPA: ClpXP protease specificity-enhancing factor [Permianibacter sp.]|nr:ClpXP protease specificity-enhancing factor [Permianibacter sp.]
MSSNRPYLLRAMYEWIIDNHCTPHLLVDARDPRVKVPREHVRDGQIVLNINPSAVGQFHWDNDHIEFSARFAGVARSMWIPMTAVLAIYARENGEGMAFSAESSADDELDEANTEANAEANTETTPRPVDAALTTAETPAPDDRPPPPSPPAPGGRSHLKVVK